MSYSLLIGIAGTSIGAIISLLYAAGRSARDIRGRLDQLTVAQNESWFEALTDTNGLRWLGFLSPEFSRGGLLNPDQRCQGAGVLQIRRDL